MLNTTFSALSAFPDSPCAKHLHPLLSPALQEFELTLNVEKFIAEADTDGSGFLEYEEFRLLLV